MHLFDQITVHSYYHDNIHEHDKQKYSLGNRMERSILLYHYFSIKIHVKVHVLVF